MGIFRDRWGTTGLGGSLKLGFPSSGYLCTNMGGFGLEMGCGHRVIVTIEFGLLSFLTLQENIKN